jgi:hypothetical protein
LQRPVDVVVVRVAVADRRDACVVSPSSARRRRHVFARSRFGDRVTGRRVRDHVGKPADRNERGCRQPPVDPPQTSQRGIASDVSSIAPHQWWW